MGQLSKLSLKISVCAIAILLLPTICMSADFKSTLELAQKGDTIAIGEIAKMYYEGQGAQKNYQEALKWAEKGAAVGDSNAFFVLGCLYHHGYGVPADHKKSYDFYYKAAEQGHAAAMNQIGNMYYDAKKYGEAEKWYVRASNIGYDRATYNLTGLRARGLSAQYLTFKDKYNEEFDCVLENYLAKQRKAKNRAKWNAIEGVDTFDKKNVPIFDVTGFDISDKVKSDDGYLVISKVKQGSIAEKLGMMVGSDLYQVDNMNTKQCNAKEIKSYISKQHESGDSILVIFMAEDGSPKRVDINLK